MSKTDDGGQAFPFSGELEENAYGRTVFVGPFPGMTLLDYFAAHAPEHEVRRIAHVRDIDYTKAQYIHARASIAEKRRLEADHE